MEKFLRENPAALCVALSGGTDPKLISLVMSQGADAYLKKDNLNKASYLIRTITYAIIRRASSHHKSLALTDDEN